MADTGENRQIIRRANAKEAEMVRASKKMVSEERSTANASNLRSAVPRRVLDDVRKGASSGVLIPNVRRCERSQHRPLVMKHNANK